VDQAALAPPPERHSHSPPPAPALQPAQPEGGAAIVAAYAVTIFTSAFLLFQVQPLISKFILPWFGGSPAVWTAAMLFFQVALFGGYLYAHLTSTYLKARGQFVLHLVLLAVAAALALYTQISPSESLKPTGNENESPLLQILMLLGVTVGVPYFALSSTGPLLQKWFSDAFHGASPYRLFALSNVGSLLALLSYPFFFEVLWDSRQQAAMWSIGFAVFAVCCSFCAWWTYRARQSHAAVKAATASRYAAAAEAAPSWWLRAAWIGLPALASVMFLAVTNEVCQNVATVPLLWIIPLSFYLISFIVAFDHPRWYSRPVCAAGAIILLVYISNFSDFAPLLEKGINRGLALSDSNQIALDSWVMECGAYFLALLLVCLICHCELAALKPGTKHLTSYFLSMSLGGALGGIFVNLIAPYVFTTFFEMPLSFLAATIISAAAIALSARTSFSTIAWRAAVISVAVVAIGASIALFSMTTGPKLQVAAPAAVARGFAILAGLAAVVGIAFAFVRLPRSGRALVQSGPLAPPSGHGYSADRVAHNSRNAQPWAIASVAAATVAALLTITYWQIVDNLNVNPSARNVTIYRARSFFGLVSVQHRSRNDKQWENYTFKSGHVPHGKEYADPARRSDTRLAYWGPDAGSRLAIEYKVQQQPHCRIGVVGLGIGTIAGFAKEGDYVRLYEINPQVTDIAKRFFHFLPDCKAPYDVVHGDARLKLEQELKENPAGHQFDLLCLDAFSGDAVPTHLLTTEAFAIYKKHLKPDGIIVCNITNTYLDLWPVIKRLADEHSFKIARVYRPTERETLVERTYFALVTNDEGFLGPVMTGLRQRLHDQLQNPDDPPGPIPEALVRMPANFQKKRDIPLWTDRYHNLFQVLR
jgi:spermidine synthase